MFYLMMHSTHFYLHFYGVGHMVLNHSASSWATLLFLTNSKGSFYTDNPTDRIVYNIAFVMPGARCSSVVRAFAHGAMGRQIDPS